MRFQRQKTIERFIADYYCHAAKLVIELDGSQHRKPDTAAYDEERTKVLEKNGLEILRFPNDRIDSDFQTVCRQIDYEVHRRIR